MSPVRFHKCNAENCTRMIEVDYKYCSIECAAYSKALRSQIRGKRLNRLTRSKKREWNIAIDDGWVCYRYKLKNVTSEMSIQTLYEFIQQAVFMESFKKKI